MITYDYLTRHLTPGPRGPWWFVPLILLPISLMIPRTVLSRWQNVAIFIPAITFAVIQAWKEMNSIDVITTNMLNWSFFLITFQDPWTDYKLLVLDEKASIERKKQERTNGNQVQPKVYDEQRYPSDFWKRLNWVGRLLGAIRLDYWKIKIPSHDRQQPPIARFRNRKNFFQHALFSIARGLIVMDLARSYMEYDPYFFDLSKDINSSTPFPTYGIPPRLLRSLAIGGQAWASVGDLFYVAASIPVILNSFGLIPDKYSPHTWPAHFGSMRSILTHGIRGLWGKYWHQTMRWSTTGAGYALADALNIQEGLLKYAILTISAFTFSGIVHMGLIPPEPLMPEISVMELRLLVGGFFWIQTIAVLIEAVVERIVVRITSVNWNTGLPLYLRMIVNGIWTTCFLTLTIPLLSEMARQLGACQTWPLPISLWQGLHGRGWWVW